MDGKWAVGIDLGGTKLKVASVDYKGSIIDVKVVPTKVEEGPKAVEKDIVKAVWELQKETGKEPMGIGIGMAGQIERESGVVRFSPNLGWHNVPLKDDLEASLGMPVFITNDVRAITWGEWIHGAGKGFDDLVCIYVGTGVGGGLVVGGKVVSGTNNTAGEVGHLVVNVNGPSCTCGGKGCLEAIAGGWAIARKARKIAGQKPDSSKVLLDLADGKIEEITAETVVKAFRAGDKISTGILNEVVAALTAGCISLVNLLNPKLLILGGGVIDGMPELVDKIAKGVRGSALPAAVQLVNIVPGKLGNDAGAIGASSLAIAALTTS